ncbi:MAG: putative alpha/beta hydrolase [Streblomastix strix]|uniref:Putative alpha/beta hydrolase n=1 Tax=Streblomastix strix TaxID=222440 RepID=A0A5J4UPT4_9EUKA|nr:MAG: putative alpha/beta hydrolase [Streblomastix strix]
MSANQIQFPEFLDRLDLKTGIEGELAQKQKNLVFSNGFFQSPDQKDQFSLYYELYGQGPIKEIFICGFGGDMDLYRRVLLPTLSRPEFQVCIFNNRGIPPSTSKSSKSQTIATMAHDAYLLIQHLGWQKVNISAGSMGGMIALEFASTYPEIMDSLTVSCGTAGPYKPSFKTFKSFAVQAFSKDQKKIREYNAKLMHSEQFLNEKHPEFDNMTGLEFTCQENPLNPYPCKTQPVKILIQQAKAIFKHKVSISRLQKIKFNGIRTLIQHGIDDQIIPFENGVFIAKHVGGLFIQYEHSVNMQIK